MSRPSRRAEILALFAGGATKATRDVAAKLRVSRQAAQRQLAALVEAGELRLEGQGARRRYRSAASLPASYNYDPATLAEDRVWADIAGRHPEINKLPARARGIAQYALTQILNNVIEHARAGRVTIRIRAFAKGIRFEIDDDGAEYTENFEFAKTRVVVKLFTIGVRFIARSEARRLVNGLERFRTVVLDFKSVEDVGQGFVDEVFRVWAAQHPDIRLEPRNMSSAVAFMVNRSVRR
jgi:hypothetical protein